MHRKWTRLPNPPPPGPAPWSRGRWLTLAAGLLTVASVLAFWQMSRPLPVKPEPESWAPWLLHPHQLNAGQRLTVLTSAVGPGVPRSDWVEAMEANIPDPGGLLLGKFCKR